MYAKIDREVLQPKNLGELEEYIRTTQNALIWAGGTYIMSRPGFYPEKDARPIIYLGNIESFSEITKNIRTVDVGCMVNTNRLLDVGNLIFSKLLLDTLASTTSSIVRDQDTMGGAICTPGRRFSIPGTLILMNTDVDILKVEGKKHTISKMPLRRIYDNQGQLNLEPNCLITKLRIEFESSDFEMFKSVGAPMRKPKSTVICALRCNLSSGIISNMQLCLTFPLEGMYFAQELCNDLEGSQVPFSLKKVLEFSEKLEEGIIAKFPSVTPLQRERSIKIFQQALFSMKPKIEQN